MTAASGKLHPALQFPSARTAIDEHIRRLHGRIRAGIEEGSLEADEARQLTMRIALLDAEAQRCEQAGALGATEARRIHHQLNLENRLICRLRRGERPGREAPHAESRGAPGRIARSAAPDPRQG